MFGFDLKTLALWVLTALAVSGWGVGCAERTRAVFVTKQRDTARAEVGRLEGDIETQKAKAEAKLKTLTAEAEAKEKADLAQAKEQEKTDAKNVTTIDGLRAELRRVRQQSTPASRSGCGRPATQGTAPASPGAAGGAQAAGLLSDPEAAADADAYDADQINEAYRSCRVRVLPKNP